MKLAGRTPEAWARAVAADPAALLSDHAHCELKAAASAMTMLRPAAEGRGARVRCQPRGQLFAMPLPGTWEDYLQRLSGKEVTGKNPLVRFTPSRKLDVPINCLDISRARRDLGWEPKLSLKEGIDLTWQWLEARGPGEVTG